MPIHWQTQRIEWRPQRGRRDLSSNLDLQLKLSRASETAKAAGVAARTPLLRLPTSEIEKALSDTQPVHVRRVGNFWKGKAFDKYSSCFVSPLTKLPQK